VSVSLPTVAVVSGQCDAAALALLAGVSLGFVTNDVSVSVDAPTVLALGLTSSLPVVVGAAPARGPLFSGGKLDAAVLRARAYDAALWQLR
jgi:O-antigen ligase